MIKPFLQRLTADEAGTSAVEMGIICGMIVVAMLVGLNNLANETNHTWNTVKDKSHDAIQEAVKQ